MFHVRLAGKWRGGACITTWGTRGRRPASERYNLTLRASKSGPHRVRLPQGTRPLQGRYVSTPHSREKYTASDMIIFTRNLSADLIRGNACRHSAQNPPPSHLLPKNLRFKYRPTKL